MTLFNIERAFSEKKKRNWSHIFVACDIHDTVIPGSYTPNNDGKEFYPGAREVLQWMTKRPDIVLIMWTSSHHKPIKELLKWFHENEITFNYVNENPLCSNTKLCDFSRKFYLSIILDDKAGMVGETDWLLIKKELQRIGEWKKDESDWSFSGCFFGFDLKKVLKKLAK